MEKVSIEIWSGWFIDFLNFSDGKILRKLNEISRLCGGQGFMSKLLYGPGISMILFMVAYDGELVGFTVAIPFSNRTEIYEMCVDPKYRGRGFATLLIEMVKKECSGKLWLGLIPESSTFKNALSVYSKAGFQIIGKNRYTPGAVDIGRSILEMVYLPN